MPAPPAPGGRLARLADLAFRRRRAVLVAWIVALVAAFAAAALAGDWSADYSTPGSESRAAAELLDERFPQRSPDTVDVVWQAPTDAARGRAADRPARAPGARRLEGIGRAAPATAADVSRDGTIGVAADPARPSCPARSPTSTGTSDDRPRAARERRRRCGSSSAARSSPTRSRARSPPRPSAWRSRRSCCCSRSARSSRRGCRSPPRCSASGSRSASSGCSPR